MTLKAVTAVVEFLLYCCCAPCGWHVVLTLFWRKLTRKNIPGGVLPCVLVPGKPGAFFVSFFVIVFVISPVFIVLLESTRKDGRRHAGRMCAHVPTLYWRKSTVKIIPRGVLSSILRVTYTFVLFCRFWYRLACLARPYLLGYLWTVQNKRWKTVPSSSTSTLITF